jgi:protein TonB
MLLGIARQGRGRRHATELHAEGRLMRLAGAALSALGHAALIALAAWALPWLRARPEPPPPVVTVSLVTDADLAALARAAKPPSPPPPPAPAPAPTARPTLVGPRFLPPDEPDPTPPPPAPEDFGLAPTFDAAAPLGLPAPETAPPPPAEPEEAEPEAEPEPEAPADLVLLRERHMRALSAAALRARVYPPAAKGRGLMGTARVYLEVARDGSLLEAGLMTSSGSASLDRAALEAARRARFPAAPEDLPGATFAFMQDLEFEAR